MLSQHGRTIGFSFPGRRGHALNTSEAPRERCGFAPKKSDLNKEFALDSGDSAFILSIPPTIQENEDVSIIFKGAC